MRRTLPAVAVCVTLLAVWPGSESAFHDPKRWVFAVAAGLGAVLTLPRWRWTALPLIALTAAQTWHSAEAGVQAMAFAWALAAWPALQPDRVQFTRMVSVAATIAAVVVVLQAMGFDVLGFAGPDVGTGRLRLYGTLGNPDFVASALLPIALLIAGSILTPQPVIPSEVEGRAPFDRLRANGSRLATVTFIVLALILTRSFATLLCAGVAAVVLMVHRPMAGRRKQIAVVIAACALLGVGLIGRDFGQTLAGRRYLVSVAGPHVADAPLLGHGLGSTVLAWPTWELSFWQARCADAECVAADPQGRFAALQDHVHADWLEWLLERGGLGLLVLLLALSSPLIGAWRSGDSFLLAAIAALLARSLVDFPMYRPADLCLLAALAALAPQAKVPTS